MHVELLCDTCDSYEVIPVKDSVFDCMEEEINDEDNNEMETPNKNPDPNKTATKIPNSVNVRNVNENFEGYPNAFAKSRKEKEETVGDNGYKKLRRVLVLWNLKRQHIQSNELQVSKMMES